MTVSCAEDIRRYREWFQTGVLLGAGAVIGVAIVVVTVILLWP